MPTFHFGDESIDAPNRTTAVHIYNYLHSQQNREVLQRALDRGINIIAGTAEPGAVLPSGQVVPPVQRRGVLVPKKPKAAPAPKVPGGVKRLTPAQMERKIKADAAAKQQANKGTLGFDDILNGTDDPSLVGGGRFSRQTLQAMLTNMDTPLVNPGGALTLNKLTGLKDKYVKDPVTGQIVTEGMLQVLRQKGGAPVSSQILGSPEYQAIGGPTDEFVTINQAVSEMIKANPDTVAKWQDDLSAGGWFGFNSKGEPKTAFRRGVPDDFTIKGFADFLEQAALRGGERSPELYHDLTSKSAAQGGMDQPPYDKGTGQDWRELLDESIKGVQDQLAITGGDGGGGGGGGGGGAGIQMPDPLAVKSLANQIAQLLMGHTLSEDQLNSIVGQVNAGAVAADAGNQGFDVEANITDWLRHGQTTGAETTAHDLVNAYSSFTNLIGPMNQVAARGDTKAGVTLT